MNIKFAYSLIAADSCSYFVFSFSFASASASFLSKMGVGICMICSKGKLRDLDNFNAVSGEICNGFMDISPISRLLTSSSLSCALLLFNPYMAISSLNK